MVRCAGWAMEAQQSWAGRPHVVTGGMIAAGGAPTSALALHPRACWRTLLAAGSCRPVLCCAVLCFSVPGAVLCCAVLAP